MLFTSLVSGQTATAVRKWTGAFYSTLLCQAIVTLVHFGFSFVQLINFDSEEPGIAYLLLRFLVYFDMCILMFYVAYFNQAWKPITPPGFEFISHGGFCSY